jgi:signal transduction histidine kinase
MKSFSPSLRLRVAGGFALLGLAVSLALGGWLHVASRDLADRLIDQALSAELEDYRARLSRNPSSLPPMTATLRGYVVRPEDAVPDVPDALLELPEGRFSLHLEGVAYRVAVRKESGRTLYMLHDRTQVDDREERFAVFLVVGIVLSTLLAAAGGWWLAGRVIAPVRQLAAQVRDRDAADLSAPLSGRLTSDEVGDLTRTFDRYLARLRAFVERERAFAADASHELRTPLAVIQGAVEVLEADDRLDQRTRDRVRRIGRASKGMADLIAALLTLSRESAGQARTPPACPVADVLREVVELHRPLLRHKPVAIDIEVAGEPRLAVERPLLAIALGNLVRNACAYTERGTITVRLDLAEVSVRDTGPGIPADELCCLFEHGDGGRRTVRGAGIGLPLVKRIADRQGWRVGVDSRPGQGATFRLQFHPTAQGAEG